MFLLLFPFSNPLSVSLIQCQKERSLMSLPFQLVDRCLDFPVLAKHLLCSAHIPNSNCCVSTRPWSWLRWEYFSSLWWIFWIVSTLQHKKKTTCWIEMNCLFLWCRIHDLIWCWNEIGTYHWKTKSPVFRDILLQYMQRTFDLKFPSLVGQERMWGVGGFKWVRSFRPQSDTATVQINICTSRFHTRNLAAPTYPLYVSPYIKLKIRLDWKTYTPWENMSKDLIGLFVGLLTSECRTFYTMRRLCVVWKLLLSDNPIKNYHPNSNRSEGLWSFTRQRVFQLYQY